MDLRSGSFVVRSNEIPCSPKEGERVSSSLKKREC